MTTVKLVSIKNGKVCYVGGKVIGVISGHGDVTTAIGKVIGKIQKDRSYKSMKGNVVTTDLNGVVRVAGKDIAKVEAAIKTNLTVALSIVSSVLKMKMPKK
jgi:hypothetical protein